MNRFVIVNGLPYLLHNGKTFAVRWTEDTFTVGAEVKLASVPDWTYSELSIIAKCAGDLDSIKAHEEDTEGQEDDDEQTGGEDTSTEGQNDENSTDSEDEGTEDTEGQEDDDEVETETSFEEMTVAELKAYAEEHGIDLDGAKKKAEIIEAIKAAE